MSSTHAVHPSTSSLGTRLWNGAATRVRNVLERLVVPVTSTEEMNEVWKLYRLTSSDAARPSVSHEAAPGAGR